MRINLGRFPKYSVNNNSVNTKHKTKNCNFIFSAFSRHCIDVALDRAHSLQQQTKKTARFHNWKFFLFLFHYYCCCVCSPASMRTYNLHNSIWCWVFVFRLTGWRKKKVKWWAIIGQQAPSRCETARRRNGSIFIGRFRPFVRFGLESHPFRF